MFIFNLNMNEIQVITIYNINTKYTFYIYIFWHN